MKYGMRRKCDDERFARWAKGVAGVLLAAGLAGYGGWLAQRAEERLRADGETWLARAEALTEATSRMGVDLGGVTRDLAPEAWAEEEANADWHVAHSAEVVRKEAEEWKAAWTWSRRREREEARAVVAELGGGALERLQGQWDETWAAMEASERRLAKALGRPWAWPVEYQRARAELEAAMEKPERVAALRDAWAEASAARAEAYGKLRAVPPQGGKEGVEREGRALSERAGALLAAGRGMGEDLEAMSRGADAEEEARASWFAQHCEEGLRGRAREMQAARAAAGREENRRAGAVLDGLGGGDAREAAREWERWLEAVEAGKKTLEAAMEGLWEHPARYGEAKEGLEAALARPEGVWKERERWAEARGRRKAEYEALSRLPRQGGAIQEALGALERAEKEARAALKTAAEKAKERQSESQSALRRAKVQYDQWSEQVRLLRATNTAEAEGGAEEGLAEVKKTLHDLTDAEESREKAWKKFAAEQAAALTALGRTAAGHRQALGRLGSQADPGRVERCCQEAEATAKGFAEATAAIEARREEERETAEKALRDVAASVKKAAQILRREQENVPTPAESAARVYAERRKLHLALAELETRGREVLAALAGPWDWDFYDEERQRLREEYEKSLRMAKNAVPAGPADAVSGGNALQVEQARIRGARQMAKDAEELLATLEGRVREAQALEGLLGRLGGLWPVLDRVAARRDGAAAAQALADELAALEEDMAGWLEETWKKKLQARVPSRAGTGKARLDALERRIRKAAGE